jgi:hypothetical protein
VKTLILLIAVFVTAVAASPNDTQAKRAAIVQVLKNQYGNNVHVDSMVIERNYAIVHGESGSVAVHVGLQHRPSGWQVSCTLGGDSRGKDALIKQCGFPTDVAIELRVQDVASDAASVGQFQRTYVAPKQAFAIAPAEQTPFEARRKQLVSLLKHEMEVGQITRQQAIFQWSQLNISTSF